MHQTTALAYNRCHLRIMAQGADIVDHLRPGLQGPHRHSRIPRVHGDGNRNLLAELLDHRDDAADFLLFRKRPGTRPGGLSAEIQKIRAFGGELLSLRDRVFKRKELSRRKTNRVIFRMPMIRVLSLRR
jgi:hypothetical protein